MRSLFTILFAIQVQILPPPIAQTDSSSDLNKETRDHYAQWIGVKAPAFPPNLKDRLTGSDVSLNQFTGKKILLYSFDAGNFVNGPAPDVFPENLQTLDRVRQKVGKDQFSVVGITFGTMFFFPAEMFVDVDAKWFDEIRKLSDFPILCSNRFNTPSAPEPYRLLAQPGSIVIDKNGIIQAIFTEQATEKQLLESMIAPDWKGLPNAAPIEDPWNGKKAPEPLLRIQKKWSRSISGIVGLTRGDWDADGVDDVFALCADNKLLILSSDGKEKQKLSIEALGRQHQTIQWTPQLNGKGLLMQCQGGWPKEIPVYDTSGQKTRTYSGGDQTAIDSASWVDIDGNGLPEMILGFNAGTGLQLISHDQRILWTNRDIGNRWCVSGFSAHGESPGLVLSSGADGTIRVYDDKGSQIHKIASSKGYITTFATAEISKGDSRQVLYTETRNVGTINYVVASNLEGQELWRYPIVAFRVPNNPPPMIAADLDNDGNKEWIFQCSASQVVAVDLQGRLLAQFNIKSKAPALLTSVSPSDQSAEYLIIGDDNELIEYCVAESPKP